jgi:hypothetical protein
LYTLDVRFAGELLARISEGDETYHGAYTPVELDIIADAPYGGPRDLSFTASSEGTAFQIDDLCLEVIGTHPDPCESPFHSADQDEDNRIGLTELLRVIQFFNSGGFQCAAAPDATEDGYLPGAGDAHGCCPHASDYIGSGPDWSIQLTELLRLIQFFNIGGYHYCPGDATEDGYCPGIA